MMPQAPQAPRALPPPLRRAFVPPKPVRGDYAARRPDAGAAGERSMSSGSVAESGIFELVQPTRLQYHVVGAVQAEAGTTLQAVLFDTARGQEIPVCGASVGAGAAERFVVRGASSLALEPGLYRWQSRLRPMPLPASGAAAAAARLSAMWAQSPEPLETHGTTEAWSTLGGVAGEAWRARGLVTVRAEGETVVGRLVVTDLATNQPAGPPSEFNLVAPMQDKDVGFVPYVLQAGRRYLARLTVQCNAAATCRIVQARA
jgi:hypothetical protein